MKLPRLLASLLSRSTPKPKPIVTRTEEPRPAPETGQDEPDQPPPESQDAPRPKSVKWLSPDEALAELVRNESGELNFTVAKREGDLRFISRTSGKMPSKGSPPLGKLDIFYFLVRGHQHYKPVRRKLGSLVTLKREPDSPHGATAIAVVNPSTRKPYGYVNKGNARSLYKRLDAGEDFVAVVMGASGLHLAVMPRSVAVELELI